MDILFAKCTDITILIHFISACNDVNYVDENNKTIFNYIIENPTSATIDLVKYIVNNNKINMEYQNKKNYKYIHTLVELYDKTYMYKNIYENILEYLIESDIDLISVTNKGWNLLHYICAYGSEKLIKLLIMKYKLKHNDCDILLINRETNEGDTPLHLVCKYKYGCNIIKFMIDNGADKTICNKENYMAFNYIPVGKRL